VNVCEYPVHWRQKYRISPEKWTAAEKPCLSSSCFGENGEKFHKFYKKEIVELMPLKKHSKNSKNTTKRIATAI